VIRPRCVAAWSSREIAGPLLPCSARRTVA
jgi:hypothetical protein